jgi:tetratricopeptide (TPR) repeat protein
MVWYCRENFALVGASGCSRPIVSAINSSYSLLCLDQYINAFLHRIGSKDDRAKRAHNILYNKRNLVDFCLAESSNFISVQKYQLAIPAASQALKFSRELDGDTSVLLVEPYLQLALASYGLLRLKECEEYLALAQWIVLNSEDCTDLTRSRLFQLMGRLSFTRGIYDKAKCEFSKAIYYSSRVFGAESVSTSIGYFRLGEVFLSLGNSENGFSFFDKVVDIWHKYLSSLLSRVENSQVDAPTTEQLNEENLSDGRQQLQMVFEHRRQVLGINHIATGEAQFTMGLFEYFLLGNQTSAEALLASALMVYNMQLGVEHASSKHVESVLAVVRGPSTGLSRYELSQFASSQEYEDPNTADASADAAPED